MFSQKELGDFELGLAVLSKENRLYAEEFFTALQVAFTGRFEDYSVGGILSEILPPERSDKYKGGYCPPFSEEIFAVMDSLFAFSLEGKQPEFGDYNKVLVTRRTDQCKVAITIKMPPGFGSPEYPKKFEPLKYEIENKKKALLATIRKKGDKLTESECRLLQRLDA